jgi:DNA-binding transcriptional regulator GbsR (MarR family)
MLAQLPLEQRLVYASVLEGATTPSEMEVVTGLSSSEVSVGLQGLQKRGLVSVEKVAEESL